MSIGTLSQSMPGSANELFLLTLSVYDADRCLLSGPWATVSHTYSCESSNLMTWKRAPPSGPSCEGDASSCWLLSVYRFIGVWQQES